MTFQNIMADTATRADELARTVRRARDLKEMQKFVVTEADLESMQEIARVTSREPALGKQSRWTELAIYYREGWTRPFVAVSLGKSNRPGENTRFQHAAMGTLDRAVNWFQGSHLRDELAAAIPVDWAPPPSAGRLATAIAAGGYQGEPTLTAALKWLYGEEETDRGFALKFERDFGMPERTIRNTLAIEAGRTEGKAGPWLQPFLRALRFFDKSAWEKANG